MRLIIVKYVSARELVTLLCDRVYGFENFHVIISVWVCGCVFQSVSEAKDIKVRCPHV